MWLFGVNPATVGLLLLGGAALILLPGVAADLAAVLLILLGLYGLAAAFAVYRFARHAVNVSKEIYVGAAPLKPTFPSPGAKAVPIPPGNAKTITVMPVPSKIASLHQAVVSVWSAPLRPGPWYAALAGTGPNGYVPVLLAAFLFLAFGLWLVPRTLGARGALIGRLTSRVQRLSETRTDAVDTAAAELRRVERDLHDGAQARLVALGMSLRAAERLFETSPGAALAMVGEAREMSSRALTELRDLVRGIHPPVLADRGLGDAVRALALETPVTSRLDIELPGRLAEPVESAAYFAVAEVLANAVKHAQARVVEIHMRHNGDCLRIAVTDDGIGGADPAKGSGLRGVERRLGTFDGILAVNSPPGGPTIAVIEVPCALLSLKISSC
jgi:signal transduction histidine kinase